MLYNEINGRHKDETIYILGSGPSLSGFDLSKLDGKIVIAVNHSIEFYPFAQYLVFGDAIFLKTTIFNFSNYLGIVVTPERHKDAAKLQSIPETRKFFFETRREEVYLNAKKGLFHPCSSGIMALNLALQFRASKIYLLGFDYFYDKGITHFFGNIYEHHTQYNENKIIKKTMKFRQFDRWRNKIYNCSLDSNVNEFRKISLDEIR